MKLITDGNPENTKIVQDNGEDMPGVSAVEFRMTADGEARFRLTLEIFDLFCDITMHSDDTEFVLCDRTRKALMMLPSPALQHIKDTVHDILRDR